MQKYTKDEKGQIVCNEYDDESLALFEALPDDRKPAWLPESSKEVKAFVAQQVQLQNNHVIESVRTALQSAIDAKAQELGFSGGNALMLYAGFDNAFKPVAQQFATWEAQVWVEAGTYKEHVLDGTKPMLSPAEAVAMMPNYPTSEL